MKKFVNTEANWKDTKDWKCALDRFESKVQKLLIVNAKSSIVDIVEDLQKLLDINIYSKFISLQHLEVNMKKIMGYLERINADHQLDDHILIMLNLLFDCATHFQKGQDSLAILILAHKSLDLILNVDKKLERKLAKAIGEHYSALREYRLAAYYLGYAVQQSGDEKEEVLALLLNQPLFKLGDLFCETPLLEFQCQPIMKKVRSASYRELNELKDLLAAICCNLLRLGDFFYSIGEKSRAKSCYERCSKLIKANLIPDLQALWPFSLEDLIKICDDRCEKLRDKQDIAPISTYYQEYQKRLKAYTRLLVESRESAKLQLDSENIIVVQKRLTSVIKEILQDCFQLACRSLGNNDESTFSLLLFGSLARGEACLRSDVEFSIIYETRRSEILPSMQASDYNPERNRLYLQSLIELFELNVIALGETGELCLSQKNLSLERVRKGIRQGLQFDDGGHYPFSRKEYAMLCMDVRQHGVLNVSPKITDKLFDGRKIIPYQSVKSIADYLGFEIVVMYGLCEATSLFKDDKLYEVYFEMLRGRFDIHTAALLNLRQLLGLWVFNSPFLQVSKVKNIHNIKEDLLRIPQWIVRSFSLFYSAPMGHGIERLQWLAQHKCIHANLALLLEIIIEYSFVCRNRAHQYYQKENDSLYLMSANEGEFSRLIFPEMTCIPIILTEIYPFFIDIIKTWQTEVVNRKQEAVLLSAKIGERSASYIFQLLEKFVNERIFTGLTISLLSKAIDSGFTNQLISKLNLKSTKNLVEALLTQANKYKYLGNMMLAKKTYDFVLRLSPNNDACFLGLGDINLILNQFELATGYYNKVVSANAKARSGVVNFLSMRFNEALRTFEEVLKNDSKNNLAMLGKAMCCLQNESLDDAKELFSYVDKALETNSVDFFRADILIFKVKMYLVLLRFKEAELVYQQLTSIKLNDEHMKISLLKPTLILGRGIEFTEEFKKNIIYISTERDQVLHASNTAKRINQLVEELASRGSLQDIPQDVFKRHLFNILKWNSDSPIKVAIELLLDNKISEAEELFEQEFAKNPWDFIAAEGIDLCKIKRNIVPVSQRVSLFSVTKKILHDDAITFKSICTIRSVLLKFIHEVELSEYFLSSLSNVEVKNIIVIKDSPMHQFFYRNPHRPAYEYNGIGNTVTDYSCLNGAIDFYNITFNSEFMVRSECLKESPEYLLKNAEKFVEARSYHRAIACYNEVISFYDDNSFLNSEHNIVLAMGLYGKGRALLLSFKVYSRLVIELFVKAFILDPRYIFACQILAFYLNSSQSDKLQNIFSQMDDILMASDESPFLKYKVYRERGDLYSAAGKYAFAKSAYLEAQKCYPKDDVIEKKLVAVDEKIPLPPLPLQVTGDTAIDTAIYHLRADTRQIMHMLREASRKMSQDTTMYQSSYDLAEIPLLFPTELFKYNQPSPKAKYIVVEQQQLEKVDKKKLGKGSYGKVYRGICTHPSLAGKEVAIKQFKKSSISLDLEKFKAEAEFQATLDSPYIVKLLAITETIPYCIVMELMDRNLFDFLNKTKIEDVTWECRYQIAYDVCSALEYLHTHNKIHSDLKSPNILLTKECNAKLSDFGLACVRPNLSSQYTFGAGPNGPRGTILWTAPELFDETQKRSSKSDIYSFGVVLWELTSHQRPYPKEMSEPKVIDRIKRGDIEPFGQNTPENYKELATQCLSLDKHARPEAGVVLRRLKFMLFALKQDQTKKGATGPELKFGI